MVKKLHNKNSKKQHYDIEEKITKIKSEIHNTYICMYVCIYVRLCVFIMSTYDVTVDIMVRAEVGMTVLVTTFNRRGRLPDLGIKIMIMNE